MVHRLLIIGFILVLTDQGRAINGPPWFIYQDVELCLLDKTVFEGYGWVGDCKKEEPIVDKPETHLETHPNKKHK